MSGSRLVVDVGNTETAIGLVDPSGPDVLGQWRLSSGVPRTDDELHLSYLRRDVDRGRMAGQVGIRVRYRQLATDWFDYLLMSPAELQELASAAGWSVEEHTEPNPAYLVVMRPL